MGVVHGVRAFAPLLVKQESGHIVNTASFGGLMPLPGMTPTTPPCMRWWVSTETLDAELKAVSPALGATVLCPGLVATPLHSNSEQLRSASSSDGVASAAPHKKRAAQGVPPQEIAEGTIEAIEAGRVHAILGGGGARCPQASGVRD
ncbi:SDR family NAD(P)-dependent oxidoreductase [Streptomyces sp. KL116D]|uniref:SDR family NAD(P)-dependent oxidoreductase n=1 Tax=Streptomyces sp. KL116D TaxID=3045152 RepID=UPI00355707E0